MKQQPLRRSRVLRSWSAELSFSGPEGRSPQFVRSRRCSAQAKESVMSNFPKNGSGNSQPGLEKSGVVQKLPPRHPQIASPRASIAFSALEAVGWIGETLAHLRQRLTPGRAKRDPQ